MIDHFTQRRMELQQQQEQAAAAQANLDRQLARDKERENYGRRKQDIAEKKVDADASFKRAQATQLSLKEAKAAIAKGQHPGTMLIQGPDGNPAYVDWKYVPGQQDPQAAPAPSPDAPPSPVASPDPPPAPSQPQPPMGGPAVMNLPFALAQKRMPPPVATETPDGQTQVDPQLEALMARAESTPDSEQTPPGSKDPVFLDRNDEGDATALLGAGGEQRRGLPIQSFPPGAREGQTFNAEDVNLRGGKGNPFATPLPQEPGPDNSIFLDRNDEGTATALSGPDGANRQELPIQAFPDGAKEGQRFSPEDVNLKGGHGNPFAEPLTPQDSPEFGNGMLPNSGSVFIPPRDIKGMSMQTGQPQGGRWEAHLPDGQVITVDPNEARAARKDESASALREIDVALADPATKLNPQVFQYLVIKKQALLGEMSMAEIKQVYAQAGTMERQGAQNASNEGMLDKRLATQEKITTENNATKRATSKYGRGGGGKHGTVVQSSGQGSAFSQLKPIEQSRIENSVNNGVNMLDREMNWTKLEGIGFDRLNLALQNIRAKGDLGGAQQMESMMNFFGYIRGGVPAKNETDEFKSVTGNLGTMLDKLGQKVGISDLWTNFSGSQADKEAIAKIAHLPEGQRAGLEQAIVESQKAIQGMALKNISAQAEAYKSAGVPFHERMQDKINSKLRFIGEKPRQWFGDSQLIPDFNGGTAAPASGGAPSGKLSDQKLLDALKGMK